MVFPTVLSSIFYGHPVELEGLTDGEFLGTTLNPPLMRGFVWLAVLLFHLNKQKPMYRLW